LGGRLVRRLHLSSMVLRVPPRHARDFALPAGAGALVAQLRHIHVGHLIASAVLLGRTGQLLDEAVAIVVTAGVRTLDTIPELALGRIRRGHAPVVRRWRHTLLALVG